MIQNDYKWIFILAYGKFPHLILAEKGEKKKFIQWWWWFTIFFSMCLLVWISHWCYQRFLNVHDSGLLNWKSNNQFHSKYDPSIDYYLIDSFILDLTERDENRKKETRAIVGIINVHFWFWSGSMVVIINENNHDDNNKKLIYDHCCCSFVVILAIIYSLIVKGQSLFHIRLCVCVCVLIVITHASIMYLIWWKSDGIWMIFVLDGKKLTVLAKFY